MAFADPIVVPVMKSPVAVDDPQFDLSGDYFSYTIRNRVFIRDSLSLILLDSFSRSDSSELTAFYSGSVGKTSYPKVKAIGDGKSVTVLSQSSKNGNVKKQTISNLPANVKTAAVNKKLTTLAFLGNDGKAYVYDMDSNKILTSFNYHSSTNDIFVTYDNKILVTDTAKTAAIYNLAGQKIKTFISANNISAIELSDDNETVVIADVSGNLNYYNANTATQIGYSPVLSTKSIKQIKLSPDSSKLIVTGRDGSLCVTSTIDILFAPNTLAQEIKQFDFSYSQIDPTKKDEIVKEFLIAEDIAQEEVPVTEYITTTQEKPKNTQKFILDEEKNAEPPVVVAKQPEQAYFPPTLIDGDKEVTLSNKASIEEIKPKVTEYKIPEPVIEPVVPVPAPIPVEPEAVVKETLEPEPEPVAVVPVVPKKAKREKKKREVKVVDNTEEQVIEEAKEPLTIIVNGLDEGTPVAKAEEKPVEEVVETVEEPAKTKTVVKKEHISLSRDWKRIRKYDDEDIKTLFKDGHGVIVNVGLHKIKNLSLTGNNLYKAEPFPYAINTIAGYRNYDLIRPFYFGGTIDPTFCITSDDFPYKYHTSTGQEINPVFVSGKVYAPLGICMYPLKNSLEVYMEMGLGVSTNCLWNGSFGVAAKRSKFQPAFYGNVKLGAAWDFINISLCGSYDAIVGMGFGIEIGALINIGGTRTIGSLMQR